MEGCFDELLAERVVGVGLGSGADPAGHAAASHDGGGDSVDLVGPGFVVLADAQEQAAAAGGDEQVAVPSLTLVGRVKDGSTDGVFFSDAGAKATLCACWNP